MPRAHGCPLLWQQAGMLSSTMRVPLMASRPSPPRAAALMSMASPRRTVDRGQRITVITYAANSPNANHQTWLARGGADAPDSPFYDLGLSKKEQNAGGAVRGRNYSFLTSPRGQLPVEVDWRSLFDDVSKPLVADLGCGAGRYVLLMAHRGGPGKNYLGIDVHGSLLDRANGWAAARGMSGHVRYLQANAVVSAGALLGSYPGPVELVSVQYPDPQQQRRRHMVGRELVEALGEVLRPGARVYLNSDFEDTAAYMRNAFERHGSHAFTVDDAHATQPVFPCSALLPASAFRAASMAADSGAEPTTSGKGTSAAAERGAAASSHFPAAPPVSRAHDSNSDRVASPPPSTSLTPGLGADCGARLGAGGGAPGAVGSDGGDNAAVQVQQGIDVGEEDLLDFRGTWGAAGWLVGNPVGAPTEREVYVEKVTGGRVFRVLLVRR
ncbi:tRNA (guanine-N(7)-)-methyltransferase [Tetrabaena socialis]|uniref:tRNA (guanine(46)-N(7))-methyltransferase n=1 Tax=Tetrabaena socialis TaxID=47790 RepID=A0A2J7ZU72_9CHLO|nr:tRNA (guanine-N(7)-)-methyltransferase [Tetrabaena socialis]|eukprot:PNH03826.1 tRNA (guanine-N(7)-)-methyltransferase [Tetrabaena socialis]